MAAKRGARIGEAVLAAVVILLGAFVAVETALLSAGPGYAAIGPKLFPWLVAGGLLLVGLALLREAAFGAAEPPAAVELDGRPLLLVTAGLIAQMLLLKTAGFVLASSLLFVAVARAFGSRRLARDAAIGVILCLVVYVAFTRGLDLSLPPGALGELL